MLYDKVCGMNIVCCYDIVFVMYVGIVGFKQVVFYLWVGVVFEFESCFVSWINFFKCEIFVGGNLIKNIFLFYGGLFVCW